MAVYNGNNGNDTYYYYGSESLIAYGNGGNDYIWSNNGNDYLYGGDGNDTLKGWYGNDFLYGGNGNDYLEGESGNDFLHGGSGSDTLIGGYGADRFYFYSRYEGVDIIKDFSYSEGDKIQISKLGFGASATTQFGYNNITGALSFLGTTFAILENKPSILYQSSIELVA